MTLLSKLFKNGGIAIWPAKDKMRACYYVEHISIQDCCVEAVLSAFTEAYGKDIIFLSGIDCDL